MDDQMEEYRWTAVRDCQGFVWALYAEYEGQALASFEGELSGLNLHEIPGASNRETTFLTRQDSPKSDFWVIPITQTAVEYLKKKLSVAGVLGKNGCVAHTQLATARQLIFSACDNFHEECVRVSMSVSKPLLERLLSNGVLKHI
jgi:hypothetical protein